jgi:hypothetical protein
MKTANFIAAQESLAQSAKETIKKPRKISPKSLANLRPPIQKGEVRNPRGINGWAKGTDVAAVLAKAVIEGNYEEAVEGLAAQLRKGNAYTFKELADRAYGKLKERKEVTHLYEEVPDADIDKRIAELERDLGLARAIDQAGRAGLAQAGAAKANGQSKD